MSENVLLTNRGRDCQAIARSPFTGDCDSRTLSMISADQCIKFDRGLDRRILQAGLVTARAGTIP
jgi:hypothetical protein